MAIFSRKNKQPISLGVVVAAAGSSSRMKGTDKQLLKLGEIPVIVRSIIPFQQNPDVQEIILVCRQEVMNEMLSLVHEYHLTKVSKLICGGNSRQQSIFQGISQLGENITHIAVHDGARPFIDMQTIQHCLEDVLQYQAVTAAVKMKDTIKESDETRIIHQTLDRSKLYITQTPQIFNRELYLSAMEKAIQEGKDYTDDCQLVESMEQPVYLSQGSYLNIKITTPEDILLGEAIASIIDNRN